MWPGTEPRYSPQKISSSAKCHLFYFIQAGTARYLRCHIFFRFYFQIFVFIYFTLTVMLFSVGTAISIKRHIFLFIVFNQYIWCIALYFSIGFYCKVPENSSFFGFCYWFWLGFISSFKFQYFTLHISLPYFFIPFLIFCVKIRQTSTKWSINCFLLTIFTNLSAQAGYDTRSIFKQSLTGLNSEFSFS